jgi:hypothetical protein
LAHLLTGPSHASPSSSAPFAGTPVVLDNASSPSGEHAVPETGKQQGTVLDAGWTDTPPR